MSDKVMHDGIPDATNPVSGSTEYDGVFALREKVLIFDTGSVPANHISAVSNYPVKYINKISVFAMIACLVLAAGAFSLTGEIDGLSALGILPLFVAGYGIWERSRGRRYGITVTLDSGDKLYFIHKAKEFIDKIYWDFVKALQKGNDFTANFTSMVVHGDYKHIEGTNVVSIDGGSSVGNIRNENTNGNNSHLNPQEAKTDAGIYNFMDSGNDTSSMHGKNDVTISGGSAAGNIDNQNNKSGNQSNTVKIDGGSDAGNISNSNKGSTGGAQNQNNITLGGSSSAGNITNSNG